MTGFQSGERFCRSLFMSENMVRVDLDNTKVNKLGNEYKHMAYMYYCVNIFRFFQCFDFLLMPKTTNAIEGKPGN